MVSGVVATTRPDLSRGRPTCFFLPGQGSLAKTSHAAPTVFPVFPIDTTPGAGVEERRGDVRHFCLYSGCFCSHLIVRTVWTEDSPAQPPCRSSLSSVDWRLWLGELLVSAPPGNTNNGNLSGREKGKDGNGVLLSVVYSHRSRCIAVIASF